MELEQREAGVKELYEFYTGLETIYAASVKALEEENVSFVTNNANNK